MSQVNCEKNVRFRLFKVQRCNLYVAGELRDFFIPSFFCFSRDAICMSQVNCELGLAIFQAGFNRCNLYVAGELRVSCFEPSMDSDGMQSVCRR